MTDTIPQVYLDEAVRRLNAESSAQCWTVDHPYAKAFARTLQELGWKPPVDPMLVRAREIVARIWEGERMSLTARAVLAGHEDDKRTVQAALIALREGMGND